MDEYLGARFFEQGHGEDDGCIFEWLSVVVLSIEGKAQLERRVRARAEQAVVSQPRDLAVSSHPVVLEGPIMQRLRNAG